MSADELASSELRKWREEEERRHIEENVMLTSDRPSNPLTPPREVSPKPVPEKKEEEPKEPKEPLPKEQAMEDVNSVEREKSIAALLESIPDVIATAEKENKEEAKVDSAMEAKEAKEEEPPSEPKEIITKEASGMGEAMRELQMTKGSESSIALAMPEGAPLFFTANVISCPEDAEARRMDVDAVMRVIGRMSVDTCQTFWESRRDHAGYDVIWWTLEMAEASSEWVSVNSVRNRGDLQHFLRNFVPDKRLGVLDTGTKEKNLYFVPPALDPVTASPVATLSFVAEGCYKQFCHLLYIRKRARPRPKTTRPSPRPSPRPAFAPHTPPGSPPPSAYARPPALSSPQGYPPRYPPQGMPPQGMSSGGLPPQGMPPQGMPPQGMPPRGYPPQGPQGPMQGPPNGLMPRGYPPQGYPPQGYPPRYPPRGYPPQGYPPQGYPPRGPPQGYPPRYPPQGYPPQGPPRGYPPQGYPPRGYPPQGPMQGPPRGYPPQSYPPRYPPRYPLQEPMQGPPRYSPPSGPAMGGEGEPSRRIEWE